MPVDHSLAAWINQAERHWKEHLPSRYARLRARRTLSLALREAAERTAAEMTTFEDAGLQPHEAWELVRKSYLFLPAEEPEEDPSDPAFAQSRNILDAQRETARVLYGDPEDDLAPT